MKDLTRIYLEQLPAEQLAQIRSQYQIGISQPMRKAIRSASASDPIVAQFLPQVDELTVRQQERSDPIGDKRFMPVPGLIHRYPNRVLWTVTPNCAVYCRFCFRKETIGRKGHSLSENELKNALTYIRNHSHIEEIILSGGDPLTLGYGALTRLFDPIMTIAHVKRIRVHTRLPIVQPQRIDTKLCQLFATVTEQSAKNVIMVIHANHWQEFSDDSVVALAALRRANVLLFSQTVLLKGVNDEVDVLARLMNTFLANHIYPYYLHHLDLAKGSEHFRLSLSQGLALEKALRQRLSGIAMPTYIVEIPGGDGKVPVSSLSATQIKQLNEMGIY